MGREILPISTTEFFKLSLYERVDTIVNTSDQYKISDPNQLSNKIGIQPGDIEAYFSLAQFDEEDVNNMLNDFGQNESLVKFLAQQEPESVKAVKTNIELINWEKPITSAQHIIENHYLSSPTLWSNLSVEYLNALWVVLKENSHGKKLWSAIKSGIKNGPTIAQLSWFIEIIAKDFNPDTREFETGIFTEGDLAKYESDVELTFRYCNLHLVEPSESED